jgi:very-short-patch-repair endonuclease
MNNFYNKDLKLFSRTLRTQSVSRAEKQLWLSVLKSNKIGVKFNRQRPIDHFIVDFFSKELGLIIEIDGNSHDNNAKYDRYRQDRLIALGFTLLRFQEGEVLNQIDEVAGKINHAVHCLRSGNPDQV